jgi:hypothetical protein
MMSPAEAILLEKRIEQELLDSGWYKVGHVGVVGDFEEIIWWLEDGNLVGDYRRLLGGYMFELEEDAVLFALAWK